MDNGVRRVSKVSESYLLDNLTRIEIVQVYPQPIAHRIVVYQKYWSAQKHLTNIRKNSTDTDNRKIFTTSIMRMSDAPKITVTASLAFFTGRTFLL
jgi:hypothetical protein